MENQCTKVLEYILKHGGITQREAMLWLGVGRLSARVYELRRRGYPIETKTVRVKNRDGSACHVARYVLGGESNG